MKEPFILRYAHLIAGFGLGLLFVLQWLVDSPEKIILLGLATVCCGISLGYVAGDRSMKRYRAERSATVRPDLIEGTNIRVYSVVFEYPWRYGVRVRSRNANGAILADNVIPGLVFRTEATAQRVADELYYSFLDGFRAGEAAMLPMLGFSEVLEPVEMLPMAPEPDPTPEPAPEPPAGVLRRLQGRKVDL